MKKLFWLGWIGLLLFEIANVYFIMPMPGSQRMNSIDAAYFLYKWRWAIRGLFGLMIIAGLLKAKWHKKWKWALILPLLVLAAVIYMANFNMAADSMFRQPKQFVLSGAGDNKVDSNRLVIGVAINGEAKAYPIRFLGYHHHVQDIVGGKPILVTYCTVCRTGRVFEPIINGKKETFRLVGMDHFNAMLEDATTKSWWQQATGKSVAGKLKGQQLPEVLSTQTSLIKWLELHPDSKVMQADSAFIASYDTTLKYESGKSKSKLTGTDSLSWKDKSWVIGVKSGDGRKAYDWNRLKKERIIHDNINSASLAVVLASDDQSFFVFELPAPDVKLLLVNDTLLLNNKHFRIDGKGIDTAYSLKQLQAYQEFWHSWRTFNPATKK
ncbi:DUF3179 domain-containing (seleno)protein [Terrimonas pollutisoli]|uniref:DUF3179 domain-containing (seleno)protein n=1 Tax=Terrimonas pollutisoli TaxID=3034147 RepID=UPI0023EAEC69|nr:DUF3179 domain-containing (seleno)protein [Terrimonas sp. H1YJ31]